MSRAASSRSKAKAKTVARSVAVRPRAARTGETRISTSEELAAALRTLAGATSSGAPVTPDTAMRNAAVYACVRVLADSVAMLPMRLYRDEGDTSTVVRGHPLDTLVNRRPNPIHSAFEFKRLLVGTLALRGNFYAYKHMIGRPTQALMPLHPDRMRAELAENGQSISYRYSKAGGGEVVFSSRDILHLRGISTDGVVGLSVIKAAAEAIGLALTAEQHGGSVLRNGASPGGVLKHPQQLSGDAAKRLRDSFDERFSGADNRGRTLLLEEGMTWEKVGMTSEESQFIDNRKFQRSEIAMFFGVPPHMIGDVERGTSWGSGIEQQGIGFVTYTLLPWLTNISQGFERDLIAESEQDALSFKFETDELVRADFFTRQQGYEIQKRNGVLSANEWRRRERMNPRADTGGDAYEATTGAATVPPVKQKAA